MEPPPAGLNSKVKFTGVAQTLGQTLAAASRDTRSNCWVDWKIMGQPCGFQLSERRATGTGPAVPPVRGGLQPAGPGLPHVQHPDVPLHGHAAGAAAAGESAIEC